MRKSQPIENNFNYKVEIQPLFSQEGKVTTLKGTRRLDNGEFLGTCTGSYGVVQNEELTDMVESVFRTNGLGAFERKVSVVRGGRAIYARYDFNDKLLTVPKVGDKVGLRLVARNSFDGSSKAVIQMGGKRLICLNGMTTMDAEFNMAKKHYNGISIDGIKYALDAAMARYSDIVQVFGEMAEVNITQGQGANILENLVNRNVISERLRENIEKIWDVPTYQEDRARTLYNLYNASTQYITHEFEAEHFESSQKVNARLGSAFVGMTRNLSTFSSMVLDS